VSNIGDFSEVHYTLEVMGWHMECPSCRYRMAIWKMPYRRACPACGAALKKQLSLRGWLILVAFVGIAGAADYYISLDVVFPQCGGSSLCEIAGGTASALLYVLAFYAAVAMGAFRYSLA